MNSFTREDILRIAQIVREETGNHIQEKNYSMLEARMSGHILKMGLQTINEYWIYFKENEKKERELLKSLMTTHYTFFFREYTHFELLQKWIENQSPRLLERFNQFREPVRVWSAACSRGQEVYSLAMFLEINLTKAFGLPFEIIGTDIDSDSISHAINGVYSIQEVNTIPQVYLNGFWKRGTGSIKDFAAIHPHLKSKTHFETLNLFETSKWSNKSQFDVIFCRNVFIYFSEENVKKTALELVKKLNHQGLLITGMSEPVRFSDWPLTTVGPSCYLNMSPLESSKGIQSHRGARPIVEPKSTQSLNSTKNEGNPQEVQLKQNILNSQKNEIPSVSKFENKGNAYKVLCVDDSATIQLLIKKIFANDPLCKGVDVAQNGREAREKLDLNKYDLITLDIHMPEVNGIEFLEKLYNKKSDPPVLMISSVSRTDIDLATKSMSLGALDYVEKPAMNNLQKSTDEILTKAKMALRLKNTHEISFTQNSFNTSIGQKIVVPDASMCMRVVFASVQSIKLLEQVVRGQKGEYRSPGLLIVWSDKDFSGNIEARLLEWTDRHIICLRSHNQPIRPNQIFLVNEELALSIFDSLKTKSVSMQILHWPISSKIHTKDKFAALQILVEESLLQYVSEIEKQLNCIISDITPSTSFPSISVEFFAHLRKGAA